jgi:uncharacterized membrane protein
MVHTGSRVSDFSVGDLAVGEVFSKSFGVLSRHLTTFILLSLILLLPMMALEVGATLFGSQQQAGGAASVSPETASMIAIGALIAVVWLFALFPGVFGAIVYVSFQDMRGRRVRLGEGFRLGYARFLAMLGAGLLMGLGVMLGMVLLVVPGIILFAMWYVAFPACIVEKTGAVESLKRSRALTDGHKWTIFAIALIALIAQVALPLIPTLLLMKLPLVQVIAAKTVQLVVSAYTTVLPVVVYHDLRAAKEGVDIEGIASVFD